MPKGGYVHVLNIQIFGNGVQHYKPNYTGCSFPKCSDYESNDNEYMWGLIKRKGDNVAGLESFQYTSFQWPIIEGNCLREVNVD